MPDRAHIFIDAELQRQIKLLAAEETKATGSFVSMKALTERLLRLGMVAAELRQVLRPFVSYSFAEEAYTTARIGQGFPRGSRQRNVLAVPSLSRPDSYTGVTLEHIYATVVAAAAYDAALNPEGESDEA